VWVRKRYRGAARLWSIGAAEPMRIEPGPADEYFGQECRIPPEVPGYFALEFEV
jgi:hypothetical protein